MALAIGVRCWNDRSRRAGERSFRERRRRLDSQAALEGLFAVRFVLKYRVASREARRPSLTPDRPLLRPAMNIAQCMTADPVTVAPEDTLHSALALMDELGVRHLPVVAEGRLVGILSDRDLLESTGAGILGPDPEASNGTVGTLMHADPVTAAPDDFIVSAVTELSVHGIGCLPVVDAGRLVGIVTETDFLRLVALLGASGFAPPGLDPEVNELARFELATGGPETTLAEAAEMLRDRGVRHLPVLAASGELVAVLSDRDLRRARGAGVAPSERVVNLTRTSPITMAAHERVSTAARLMSEHKVGAVAIVGGPSLGLVTTTDILEHALRALH
jgi:CBS domain-containing protein